MSSFFGGLFNDLLNRTFKPGRRIKTQSLTIIQDLVLEGACFTTKWREDLVAASGGLRYAEVDVPAGFYMALYRREIDPSGPFIKYKVFPEGTYTAGATIANDADSFCFSRNLRQGATPVAPVFRRTAITTAPNQADFIIYNDLFGTEISGSRAAGTVSTVAGFLLLNGGQKFLLQLSNGHNANASVAVDLEYAMIPYAAIPKELSLGG